MSASEQSVNRREFAKRVALGTGVIPLAGCLNKEAAADSDISDKKKTPEKKDAPKKVTPPSPADLLLDVVNQQYPHAKLDAETLRHIHAEIRQNLRTSKILSEFPLTNADEPAFVFAAYRDDSTN
jgi:hypothetical protein